MDSQANQEGPGSERRFRHAVPMLVGLVGVVATLAATLQVSLVIDGRDERRFAAWVERTHGNMQDRMQARVTGLQNLTIGLLGDADAADGWSRQYAQQLMRGDPSIRGIGFAVEAASDETASGEETAARAGGAASASQERPVSSVYFHPSPAAGDPALGRLDFLAIPTMQEAMRRALDLREPTSSGPVRLPASPADGAEQATALMIFIPVHFGEESQEDGPDRPAFRGCVYALVDGREMWSRVLPDHAGQRIFVDVYEGPSEDPGRLVWSRKGGAEGDSPGRFRQARTVEAVGRPYTLVFESSPAFEAASLHWPVVSGTLVIGLAVTVGLTLLSRSQTRAWQAADEMSSELRASQHQLQEVNATLEKRVADRTAVAAQRAAQLQRLAWRLTQAEQDERRRLARVLHDHLQQLLVAARMQVGQLELMRDPQPAEVARAAAQLDELIHEAIEASRSLTVELSPPVLYSSGLTAALEWLGEQTQQKYNLQVHLASEERIEKVDVEMDEKVRVFLFEAVRELLFNVAKHAGVGEVHVRVAWLADERKIQVEVIDEGVGFDPEKGGAPRGRSGGFGLFSVRERLQLLGGDMTVHSKPQAGTRVTLTVPFHARAEADQASGEPPEFGSVTARDAET